MLQLCVNHSAHEEAEEAACVCWIGGEYWGPAGSPPGLPAMGIDISVWLCCSLLGSEGTLHFYLYFIAFYCGILSYTDLLEYGDTRQSGDSFSANAKGLAPSPFDAAWYGSPFFSLTFPADLHWLAFVWFLTQFLLGQILNVSSHAFAPWIRILVSSFI